LAGLTRFFDNVCIRRFPHAGWENRLPLGCVTVTVQPIRCAVQEKPFLVIFDVVGAGAEFTEFPVAILVANCYVLISLVLYGAAISLTRQTIHTTR
jgi:hypothetical protein